MTGGEMKMRSVAILGTFIAGAIFAAGCGGGGGGGGQASPEVGLPTATRGFTSFNQTVPTSNTTGAAFVGQANGWQLDNDFEMEDGLDDQFDGALLLTVNGVNFPSDQTYSELTWSTPFLRASDGVVVAGVAGTGFVANRNGDLHYPPSYTFAPLSGSFSAMIGPGHDVSFRQRINLAAASGASTLSWKTFSNLQDIEGFGGQAPTGQVLLRSLSGVSLTGDISGSI
jgi:hypothetical protein